MKPYLFSLEKKEDEEHAVSMLVDASSAGNIKPGLVMQTLYQFCGLELDEFALLITREETYTNIGTEEEKKFVSLGAVGEDY